jgi:hypothetical protein
MEHDIHDAEAAVSNIGRNVVYWLALDVGRRNRTRVDWDLLSHGPPV